MSEVTFPARLHRKTRVNFASMSAPTILLVEDETLTRVMLAEELQARGYTVIKAADADEALTLLSGDNSIDLLLTDVKMPRTLDGAELARTVGAAHPDMKVIVASGHIRLSDRARNDDAAFEKPYELEELFATVAELLETPKGG